MTARTQLVLLVLVIATAATSTLVANTQTPTRGLRMLTVETRGLAESVRADLENGAFFGRLARERSIDGAAAAGGYMGRVRPQDLRPEFQRALEGLAPGRPSPVVEVDGQYVILQLVTDTGQAWKQHRDDGREALATGALDEAEVAFAEALRISEDFKENDYRRAQSLNNLGALAFTRGNYERAADLFDRAHAILAATLGEDHPDVASSLQNQADAYSLAGNYPAAEAALETALGIRERTASPDSALLARTLGNLALVVDLDGRPSEARTLYERALGMSPGTIEGTERAQVLVAYGSVLESLGDFTEAASAYEDAHHILETDLGPRVPATLDALARSGNARHRSGAFVDAAEISERLLMLRWGTDAESPVEPLELLTELLAVGTVRGADFDVHRDRFLEALGTSRLPGDVYLFISDILSEADMAAEALLVLETIRPQFPGSRLIEYEIGETYARAGSNADAARHFERAASMPAPPDLSAEEDRRERGMFHRRAGDMYLGMSDFDAAATQFLAAVDLAPEVAEGHVGRANLWVRMNMLDEALAEYAAALELDPGNVGAMLDYAEALLQSGRLGEAIDIADMVLETDPEQATAFFLRGTGLARSGRPEDAASDLQRYADLQAAAQIDEERSREILVINREVALAFASPTPEDAIDVLQAAVARYPDVTALHLDLATALIELDRAQDAVDTLGPLAQGANDGDFLLQFVMARASDAAGNADGYWEHRSRYLAELLGQLSLRF